MKKTPDPSDSPQRSASEQPEDAASRAYYNDTSYGRKKSSQRPAKAAEPAPPKPQRGDVTQKKQDRSVFDKEFDWNQEFTDESPGKPSRKAARTPAKREHRAERPASFQEKPFRRDRPDKGGQPRDDERPRKRFDDEPSPRSSRRSDDRDAGEKRVRKRVANDRNDDYGKISGRPYARQEGRKFSDKKSDRPRKPSSDRSEFDSRRGDRRRSFQEDSFSDRRPSRGGKSFEANRKPKAPAAESDPNILRLNRYIANSGVCSRREADELIAAGQIEVNGNVVTELGTKVKRDDVVKYKGRRLSPEKPVYVLLNKPKDFITTLSDPQERKTVMQLVENAAEERIYPVGRLDRNTTGLLLFTNDGALADKLSHPSSEVKKIYQVDLNKPLAKNDLEQIQEGVMLEDGLVPVDDIQVLSADKTVLGLEIHVGRNRVVRRLFEHLGYDVVRLDRVMYAGLTKKDLSRGKWRYLTEKELNMLKRIR
ncbi:23S rRNA pseudouridine2605 synthase [Catalinimonas alkaloidigena]|uniref:Pseudouridine synthase n=1 Tax=Catalinimonas alkaloidigena TaxID=1075417 RepID=A0A1G9Q4S8_9BACT|nr:pseudouridine synthase [Catalinimonas alkaloidigena]SDM06020.1 23S rRNA pseudouridine2605 synthase [Catalinimonas alkaloidigena]